MPLHEPLGVLVIEDDADTRANLSDILELDDYRVECASRAAEINAPRDWSSISVVILDRKLPDGTADQILPVLRRVAPHVAVIIATGYADVDGAIAAVRHGASDYLLKPVQPEALRATLARIAERRRLESENRRHEAAFRAVVETSPCAIVILRDDDGIVYFSRYAEELTGYRREEAVGKRYSSLLVSEQDAAAAVRQLELLRRGTPIRDYENRIRRRDATELDFVWNANRLADYEGEPAVLLVGLDITARKRAEERALQAQRLAAIGQTMTGLVHESRNALQRSRACLEMLALEVEKQPEALDLVNRIQKAQDHLQHLYEEVRQYAAPIKLSRAPTDLRSLWREIWNDLAPLRNERKVRLDEGSVAPSSTAEVDAFAVGQVWRNIFENAIHVSPEGARVSVECAETELDGRPALRLSFRDQGPGLGPEQRKRIFEPFFTTKTKGTGLGMAIAKRIIESHGGQIGVDDAPGGGAEIVVVLPRGNI